MKKIKCVVVGSEVSEKTSLIAKFLNQNLKNKTSQNWLNEQYTHVTLLDEHFLLQIFDTPGEEDYESIRKLIYKDVDVFIICFSVISIDSFDAVTKTWIPEIKQYKKTIEQDKKIPIILAGLQIDLRSEDNTITGLSGVRPIQKLEGYDLASHIGAYSYFECSSMTKEGIQDVFESAINGVINNLKITEQSIEKKKKKINYKCILM